MTDRIGRYVRGELRAEEARELAQASLDSPELFDELTGAALAKAALNPQTVRTVKMIRMPRRIAMVAGSLGVAAAALVLVLLPHRPNGRAPNLKPVLELTADAGQPVLLAGGLHPADATVFRGGDVESRMPRATGSIVSVEDGAATVDLGSLDGLAKGSSLQVFRGPEPVGRLQVTAVFRERARASVMAGGKLRPKDAVRVGDADHLSALLQQADAAYRGGDSNAAIQLAGDAVRWGESVGVPPEAMAVSWNELAVLHLLRGEYGAAESLLARAGSAASKTDPLSIRILNNVGVLAELRGDRVKAVASYDEALRTKPEGQQLETVERNLARVRGSR